MQRLFVGIDAQARGPWSTAAPTTPNKHATPAAHRWRSPLLIATFGMPMSPQRQPQNSLRLPLVVAGMLTLFRRTLRQARRKTTWPCQRPRATPAQMKMRAQPTRQPVADAASSSGRARASTPRSWMSARLSPNRSNRVLRGADGSIAGVPPDRSNHGRGRWTDRWLVRSRFVRRLGVAGGSG